MAGVAVGARIAIVVGYVAVFWLFLPLGLVGAGLAIDAVLGLAPAPSPWGWPLVVVGLAFVCHAALVLRRDGLGLPISALPPRKLVTRGPYRLVRHPIYVSYQVALVGMALLLGSPGLIVLAGPGFLLGWVAYALDEERRLRRRFGEAYRHYQSEVGLLPRPPFYRVAWALLRLGALPVGVEYQAPLPRGAFVVVANHACYLDPVLLTRITARRIRFLTTAEMFRGALPGWVFRCSGGVPLRRYRPDASACRTMLRLLEAGEIVGIFPEGERSPLGAYQGAMESVAAILPRLGVPVIPVGISGSYDVGPRWSDALRRRPVKLRVGRPVVWRDCDPKRALDAAIIALLDEPEPRVRLAGLRLSKLHRVLWACPRCFDEAGWRAAELRCLQCGARFYPEADGSLVGAEGQRVTLTSLGTRLAARAGETTEIACRARGFNERSSRGSIGPLVPLGVGDLRITLEGLSFEARVERVVLPLARILSTTTERADTLQVAAESEMWQFRVDDRASVFRLALALKAWSAASRPSQAWRPGARNAVP